MTKAEYLLVCLMEECAEIQQVAAKALRFGLNDIKPSTGRENRNELLKELNDLYAILDMLDEEGITLGEVEILKEKKRAKLEHYMRYSIDQGVL